jgi:hypothetical protein
MHIPASIIRAALPIRASVGRDYDSTGKHVAYWYAVTPEWKVYRHSVGGMLALLREIKSKSIGPYTK